MEMEGTISTGLVMDHCKGQELRRPPPVPISPLLITHVLEKIFDGASLPDLIRYRQVCREWNNVATKFLQGKLDAITVGLRNTGHGHSRPQQNSANLSSSWFPHPTSQPIPGSSSYPSSSFISFPSGSNNLVKSLVNKEQLEKFLQIISSSTNPPFVKYEIVTSFFIPENESILTRFFELSSPFTQVLKISLDHRAPGEFSPGFLSHLAFPKLRSLVVEVFRHFALSEETTYHMELRDNAVSDKILSRILFGANSLESLELSLQRKCDEEGQRRFNHDGTPNFEGERRAGMGGGGACPCQCPSFSYDEPRICPSLWSNNIVSINDSLSGSIPSSSSPMLPTENCHLPTDNGEHPGGPLIGSSPKLKKLHLRLRNCFIHQHCVTSLLHRFANSLEELSFTEEGYGSRVVIELPKMKRLKKLTISAICEFEHNFATFLPLNYSEQLPHLTSLYLWDCFGTEKRYEQLFSGSTISQTLTALVFPSQLKNVAMAQTIPHIFPNLKSLKMVFSARLESLALIEAVFQGYESLEELHLITDMNVQNQNMDHVLTGLPIEICRKMKSEERYVLPLYLQGMERKASLVDLKKLKRLIFELEHKYSRVPLITDVTGYLAFMELPKLEFLRFTRFGMSWNCYETLAKKCKVDVLDPEGTNVFEVETIDFDFEGIL